MDEFEKWLEQKISEHRLARHKWEHRKPTHPQRTRSIETHRDLQTAFEKALAAYNDGLLSSEQALFQCMFYVAKPSQRRLWTLIHQCPGITTAELQQQVPEWTHKMVATTCKNLLDMGLVRRETHYVGDIFCYRYYAVKL